MTTEAMQPRRPKALKTLSYGDKVYKHRGILAKPHTVLLDEKRNILFVVERGSQRPSVSANDALSARLCGYVISHVETRRFGRRRAIRLYVAVGDHTQVEIDAQLENTKKLVDHWQAHRRLDGGDFRWIPASVLAMALTQHMYCAHPPIQGV